ncbi:MAG: glycosyltransferase [Pirellulaceae bacterium]|nr:glycosyltransferase [Pirellulaceae bacterium]
MKIVHSPLIGHWRAPFLSGWSGVFPGHRHIVVDHLTSVEFEVSQGAAICISHSGMIGVADLSRLAAKYPETKFVYWAHTPLSKLPSEGKAARMFRLCRERPNCFFVTSEARSCLPLLDVPRVLICPPPVAPVPPVVRSLHQLPVVLVSSRGHDEKGIASCLVAMRLLSRERRIRPVLALTAAGRFPEFAAAIGLQVEQWRFCVRPGEWPSRLRDDIDVLLTPSMVETFGLCGIEAMQHGRPIVGSLAMAYCPPQWQCDPNDPREIAGALRAILDGYTEASATAGQTAAEFVRLGNERFAETIRGIIGC